MLSDKNLTVHIPLPGEGRGRHVHRSNVCIQEANQRKKESMDKSIELLTIHSIDLHKCSTLITHKGE
jgi:hypothetical protein|nr:MAG TPA: hypothetical protein [Caudoviricetes sp.]